MGLSPTHTLDSKCSLLGDTSLSGLKGKGRLGRKRREVQGQNLCAVEGLELKAAFTHVTGSLVGLKPFDEHCLGTG